MRKNIRLIAIFCLLSFCVFFVGEAALAQDLGSGLEKAAKPAGLIPEQAETSTVEGIIGRIIKVGFGMMGIVFLIMILYSGIVWMTAGGAPETTGKAQTILIHSAIGMAVTLVAYQVTHFVMTKIGAAFN